jgi:ABC-2 type transport system permease protein
VKAWIAFWNILVKDMRAYYLKPPNISWGLIFPLAWTGMFFIRSGVGRDSIPALLPGVIAVSILFGTTSMLAVTVTFEKKGRSFEMDLSGINWLTLVPAVALIAVSSTFLGLFIAVSVREVFEAQTFSNFFRFPMLFLCGLFFPVEQLPVWVRPLSYALPLTYGADILHASIQRPGHMALALDFGLLAAFCAGLFAVSLWNIRRRWIS